MSSINVQNLTPYIVTLDRNSPSVSYDVLKNSGVVGLMIEIGYLFTPITHLKQGTLHNPKLMSQINFAKENSLDYGFIYYGRAQTKDDVKAEVADMSAIIRLNYAKLGIWIKPDSTVTDALLDVYYDELEKLHVTDRVGLYCERSYLNKIKWSKHYLNWYLWLIEPVKNISELDELLTPEFFDVEL